MKGLQCGCIVKKKKKKENYEKKEEIFNVFGGVGVCLSLVTLLITLLATLLSIYMDRDGQSILI
jgi:hypothetical protein